jgi:hypothetical protein
MEPKRRTHIVSEVEQELLVEAERISEKYEKAPIVIIVGGVAGNPKLRRTMTVSVNAGGPDQPTRLRDLLGILQTAIQMESWKHIRETRRMMSSIGE